MKMEEISYYTHWGCINQIKNTCNCNWILLQSSVSHDPSEIILHNHNLDPTLCFQFDWFDCV